MTNSIVNAQQFAVTTAGAVNLNDIASELEGLGSISLDAVKVPSGGGIVFEVPSDDPNNPATAQALNGVIVYHHALNCYWSKAFTGENEAPDCMSLNGKDGLELKTKTCKNCQTCPLNKFAEDGSGKKCRNMHRLYIMLENASMPIVLNVPPSSLGAFKTYITKAVLLRGRRLGNVVTQITLKKAKSNSGITYSQLQFAKVGDLTSEQVAGLEPLANLCMTLSQKLPETSTDDSMEELDSVINQESKEELDSVINQESKELKDRPIEFEDVDELK